MLGPRLTLCAAYYRVVERAWGLQSFGRSQVHRLGLHPKDGAGLLVRHAHGMAESALNLRSKTCLCRDSFKDFSFSIFSIFASSSFARLLMPDLKATSARLALRPKYRLNSQIHDVLATKMSYLLLFFIENTTPREMGALENLRHYICMLQVRCGPSFPISEAIKTYKKR